MKEGWAFGEWHEWSLYDFMLDREQKDELNKIALNEYLEKTHFKYFINRPAIAE